MEFKMQHFQRLCSKLESPKATLELALSNGKTQD
jgi:hypothetical protein